MTPRRILSASLVTPPKPDDYGEERRRGLMIGRENLNSRPPPGAGREL